MDLPRLAALGAMLTLACQPAAPVGLSDADRQAIVAQHTAFTKGVEGADWAGVMNLYVDDAVVLAPNAPAASGKTAIAAVFRAVPPVGDFKLNVADIISAGHVAMVRGSYTMNVMPPGTTTAVADTGKYIEAWKQQADGSWKLAWDMWSSDLALPAPAAAPPKI